MNEGFFVRLSLFFFSLPASGLRWYSCTMQLQYISSFVPVFFFLGTFAAQPTPHPWQPVSPIVDFVLVNHLSCNFKAEELYPIYSARILHPPILSALPIITAA